MVVFKIIEKCLNTRNKFRGRLCIFCVLVAILGVIFTLNNFLNKPLNATIQIERQK